uniref:NADH-ubiquinone oxidoreductase chain 1 n=1 Tax=Goeldia sp. DPP-2018 TaxID=2136113 RepID=A0A2U8XCR0_9ARAC|nr:NADH dehydrogenase subunit 1 [Goeldia sp. DPP-2018]
MNFLFNLIISIISLLISVAFYTIIERKILSYIQIRKGPNKVGFLGILQPFSDAIKLFNKNLTTLEMTNFLIFSISPIFTITISILIIPLLPLNLYSMFDNKNSFLMFFIISSMGVYSILMMSWSSNSKYCYLGSIRSVSQLISYEISFFMIIFIICILSNSYSFTQIKESQNMLLFFYGNILILLIWLSSCLGETNRSPFDFAEGESELVSGFNVEYMGSWFALIFLAEYLSMLILSMMTSLMFFKSINIPFTLLTSMFLIWIRGTVPRFRYDMLMTLNWKLFIPILLFFMPIPLILSFYFFSS